MTMARPEPKVGAEYQFEYVVQEEDTAAALSDITGEAYPRVFATTKCIALLELAAGKLLIPLLRPGELSVGARVEVDHLAATPVGARVIARARYTGLEGKLYSFEVVAHDGGGEIMRGVHKRAIVDEARLLSSAAKRNGAG
jgi:fluoroacetyl-CoA thioesterase